MGLRRGEDLMLSTAAQLFLAHAVDAVTHDDFVLPRLDVDVGGAGEIGVLDDAVGEVDDGSGLFVGKVLVLLARHEGVMEPSRPGTGDHFVDDEGSQFEESINKLATHDITLGCNPPDNDMFCPDRTLTRGEMASFFTRAKGL